ncbi:MAG: ABC transporter ATP-binding protein [Oscillospiraceae bacterium]|nr:ABC transporter ATP-binding protein [Oscillospiraceae bacterium]MBQ9981383.1 ABC transporter ATP-binding protein [Oscillospiraceae bacterium]
MIEIKNLEKAIDGTKILDGIDLEIKKGSVFGLLGSNGAGKSTLLRHLCGVYKQDSGSVLIDGAEVYDNADAKRKIFFVNDETVQFTSFTLSELKEYYKVYYPEFSEELFEKLRKSVNLPLKKKLGTFSKGMKRQAIVIVGLSCQTEYLLLDEAFDGLDPAMRMIVKNMLFDSILDRQLTVVISSHNLREISEICDTAGMMHDGKIVFCREIDGVDNVHKLQVAFKEEYTKDDFVNAGLDVLSFKKNKSVYEIIIDGEINEITKKINTFSPIVFDSISLTLEEIFLYEMESKGYYAQDILDND